MLLSASSRFFNAATFYFEQPNPFENTQPLNEFQSGIEMLAVSKPAAISVGMGKTEPLSAEHISDIIQMALSDHVSFTDIQREYGLPEKQVVTLMKRELKPGSYKAWRKRVRAFGDRRETYK